MIKQLELEEFKKRYLFSEKRQFLFQQFMDELANIKKMCLRIRVLVFGSFIRKKKEPNDIDILINLIPTRDSVYTFMKEGMPHKHPREVDIQFSKNQYFLKNAEQAIEHFNNNPINVKDGIKIKNAVEIVDI